jgi:hypothetical protein
MKLKTKTPTRVSPDQFGLDELVIDGVFVHVERMDRGHMWMRFSSGDEEIDLNFHAKKGTIEVVVDHHITKKRDIEVVVEKMKKKRR